MLDLVGGLGRDRFAPLVVTPDDGPYFAQYQALGVPGAGPARAGAFRPSTLAGIVAGIRRHRVRLVHSHGKGAGLYGRLAAALTRVPAVHSFQGLHHRRHGRVGQKTYLALERMLARTDDLLHPRVALGDGGGPGSRSERRGPRRRDSQRGGLRGDRSPRWPGPARRARRSRAWPTASPVVGYVARISPQKGLEDFVRAMRAGRRRRAGGTFRPGGRRTRRRRGLEASAQRARRLAGPRRTASSCWVSERCGGAHEDVRRVRLDRALGRLADHAAGGDGLPEADRRDGCRRQQRPRRGRRDGIPGTGRGSTAPSPGGCASC